MIGMRLKIVSTPIWIPLLGHVASPRLLSQPLPIYIQGYMIVNGLRPMSHSS